MNTAKMLFDAFIHDGGTYRLLSVDNPYGFQWLRSGHINGFFVSRPRGVENLPEPAISVDLIERIVTQRHLFSGLYLGLWKDEHGNWSVDETEWFPYFSDAINAGARNEQRSIWDIRGSQAISIELASSLI